MDVDAGILNFGRGTGGSRMPTSHQRPSQYSFTVPIPRYIVTNKYPDDANELLDAKSLFIRLFYHNIIEVKSPSFESILIRLCSLSSNALFPFLAIPMLLLIEGFS